MDHTQKPMQLPPLHTQSARYCTPDDSPLPLPAALVSMCRQNVLSLRSLRTSRVLRSREPRRSRGEWHARKEKAADQCAWCAPLLLPLNSTCCRLYGAGFKLPPSLIKPLPHQSPSRGVEAATSPEPWSSWAQERNPQA